MNLSLGSTCLSLILHPLSLILHVIGNWQCKGGNVIVWQRHLPQVGYVARLWVGLYNRNCLDFTAFKRN